MTTKPPHMGVMFWLVALQVVPAMEGSAAETTHDPAFGDQPIALNQVGFETGRSKRFSLAYLHIAAASHNRCGSETETLNNLFDPSCTQKQPGEG